jgi:hypothetical protein
MNPHTDPTPALPWWRVRMMWLVIAGPVLVVLAGIATTVIAVRGGDVPLRKAQAAAAAQAGDMTPAGQARNHAATPRR